MIETRFGDGPTTARVSRPVVISRIFASDQRSSLLVSHFGRAIAEDNEIENLLTKSSKKGERRQCQIDLSGRYGAERSDFFSAGGDDSSDRSLLYLQLQGGT